MDAASLGHSGPLRWSFQLSFGADEVKVVDSNKRARHAGVAVLAVVIVTPALLLWAWSRPNPTPPREQPLLILSPAAVDEALRAQRALDAPTGDAAETRLRLYRESNTAEHDATDYPGAARLRHERLIEALHDTVEQADAPANEVIQALRATDTERAARAVGGELSPDELVPELGAFPEMMESYRMAADGHQTAPDFVVRTALMARWNAMHARPITEGFEPVHLRAYWGWLALHTDAPLSRRLEALQLYAEAGGVRVAEARALLLYDVGDLQGARRAFDEAYAARGTFRLRNQALACTP